MPQPSEQFPEENVMMERSPITRNIQLRIPHPDGIGVEDEEHISIDAWVEIDPEIGIATNVSVVVQPTEIVVQSEGDVGDRTLDRIHQLVLAVLN